MKERKLEEKSNEKDRIYKREKERWMQVKKKEKKLIRNRE